MCCNHEWIAVAPTGTTWLECPACASLKRHFVYPFERQALDHWQCNCNNLFNVTKDGYYCPHCGEWQHGF